VNVFEEDGYPKLIVALKKRASDLGGRANVASLV